MMTSDDAGIGWGDLLRVLQALPVAQRLEAASALGYAPCPGEALPLQPPPLPPEPVDREAFLPPAPAPASTPVAPASKQTFWRVMSDLRDPQAQTEAPDWFAHADMPDAAVFECDPAASAPMVAPLVSAPRLAPFLRRHLARTQRSRETDVPRLMRHLTRHEPIRRWPVRERVCWPGRVCVVLDTRHGLMPLDDELRRIVTVLKRLLGPRLVAVTTDRGMPSAPRDGRSVVVVLGDAGQGGQDVDEMRRWAAWGRSVAQAGERALMLAPVPGRLVRAELARAFDLVLLDDEPVPLRVVGRTGWRSVSGPPAAPHDIGALRAALFGHSYVTPDLLRDLRRTLVGLGAALDVGSEQAVWHDAAVSGGSTACTVRRDMHEAVARAWGDERVLSAGMREAVVGVMWRHLQAASPFVRAEYARRLVGRLSAGHVLDEALRAGVEAADRLAQQACVLMAREGSTETARSVAAYTGRFGLRGAELIGQAGEALQAMWLVAQRREVLAGRVTAPAGLRLDRLHWLMRQEGVSPRSVGVQVVQEGESWMLHLDEVSALRGAVLATADLVVPLAVVEMPDGRRESLPVPGSIRGERVEGCRLRLGERVLEIEPFSRPDWAEALWFDQGEWHARLPEGRELIWMPASWWEVGQDQERDTINIVPMGPMKCCWWDAENRRLWRSPTRYSGASRFGMDDIGHWMEFTVQGQHGSVTQRLRWIEPGEFLMGSPKGEKERWDGEAQHHVVLTQGYWLADTACTQELWEAVMGENPSRFKGDPQNPVEQVSWNDITEKFLPKLNELVPGLNLTLPTEAQWEYGCRAGTTTPFSFGEQITPEQVNYDGNYPYAGGKKGKYREKTVPVKALPANQWGLYQMHGNVWEWCQDEMAAYPEGTSIDPVVHQDKKEKDRRRVLRGGGWIGNGGSCRSAYRFADAPDDRDDIFGFNVGFRLARGLADQPDQHRKFFGQPEAGGAKPPGISGVSRSSESEASPPEAAKIVKNNVTSRLRKWLGFGQKDKP